MKETEVFWYSGIPAYSGQVAAMSVPQPPTSLDKSCSVIHDNILYSFSPEAFLSLALEEGAKWKKLNMGEKVSGASCVGTDSAMFVVGGTTDNADFTGLQKYTYSSKEWSTITPTDLATKNRQWHSTTYIKANDAIVMYAGSQDGVYGPSSQTFSIQASEPYTLNSYTATSPPALLPILLSWSDADAVMVGGDATNTKVYLFNPIAGWRDFGASLADPIAKDTSSIQGIMMDGGDGSKSLITFDMTQSPNHVDRIVLQDENGTPVTNSAPVANKGGKRDLTLSNWPNYDSDLAPTSTRTNFAIAQGDDGTVVFTGGNSDDPIAMFDANENSWMNATDVFSNEKSFKIKATASSTVSSTTATSTSISTSISSSISSSTTISSTTETTAASTSDAAVAPASGSKDDHNGLSSNTILGITLGTILGFLAVLGLLVLLLRRRKRQQNHTEIGHARRASGLPAPDEKDPAGFTNDSFPPRSPGHFRGHHPQLSQESYSSMAILMGRMGQQKASLSRKPSNDTSRSSVSSLHKQFKSTISKPIPQASTQDDRGVAFAPTTAAPRPRPRNGGAEPPPDGMRRSSGWNRYWSGGSALQILGFGGSKRNTVGSEQSSRYSEGNSHNPRITQDSATVPPLNFDGRPEVNSVVSGSPVVAQQHNKMLHTEGMSGKIEVDRPVSKASSGYSSGIPESVSEAWNPAVEGSKPWGTDRAPSSAYAPSYYYGTSQAPSVAGSRKPPSGVSQQPQLAMASTSDMSWLNLGDQSRV